MSSLSSNKTQPPKTARADENQAFRIVAIDDDPLDLWMLQQFAEEAEDPRCVIEEYEEIEAAVAAVKANPPQLVILDDRVNGVFSADAGIDALRASGYFGPVAVVSGAWRPGRRQALVQRGAIAFLDKDDLTPTAFMGLVDMAQAAGSLLRPERATIGVR